MALSLVVVSCSEKEEDPTPSPTPTPEPGKVDPPVLSASDVTVTGKGATYSVPFTVQNPVSGKSATVTVPQDAIWITSASVSGNAASVTVTDNLAEARSTEITISYPDAKPVVVKFTQDKFDWPEFKIEMSDPSPFGATFTVTRNNSEYSGGYFFEVMNKTAVEKYVQGDKNSIGDFGYADALYKSDLEYLEGLAIQHGHSLAELFTMIGSMYTKEDSVKMPYSTLKVDTDYYFVVYGMEEGTGKRMTPVCLYEFTTGHSDASGLTFKGTVSDITETSAVLNINPSNNDEYWYWDYISEIDLAKYSLDDVMQNSISILKQYLSTYTWEQILVKGSMSNYQITSLLLGTEYTIVAWGMNLNGTPTTAPIVVGSFKTRDIDIYDDCTFQVDVLAIEDMDVKVRVTPSNPSTVYYTAFVEESRMEGYTINQAAQRIINMEANRLATGYYDDNITWENLPGLASGTQEIWGRRDYYWTFLPDHTYNIYVFGIDGMGIRSTEVEMIQVTTKNATESDNHFSVNFVSSTWQNLSYEVVPEIKDEKWMPFLIETADLDLYRDPSGKLDEKSIMAEIEEYYEDEIVYHNYEGNRTLVEAWIPDTDYTLLVFGFAGTNTTPMYEYKIHSPLPPFEKSTADFSYTYELFRGEDLTALDPRVWPEAEFAGDCIMVVWMTPTENAKHWYWGVWPPVQNFANEGGMYYLMKLDMNELVSAVDKKFYRTRPWWYGSTKDYPWVDEDGDTIPHYPWSISGWAEDEDGNYGPWHYELFIPIPLPKDQVTGKYEVGYTEAYNFWTAPSATSSMKVYSVSSGKELPVASGRKHFSGKF